MSAGCGVALLRFFIYTRANFATGYTVIAVVCAIVVWSIVSTISAVICDTAEMVTGVAADALPQGSYVSVDPNGALGS